MFGIDPIDSLKLLRFDAGLDVTQGQACPPVGELHAGQIWGDIDCSGDAGPIDSLKTLRHDAGLGISQEEGCPNPGALV
jgi:hypothetical protein